MDNTYAQELASKLDAELSVLEQENEKAVEKFLDEFKKLVADVNPIIMTMKKHNIYFVHPDLPQEIRTTHGPIIARELSNQRNIYVLRGDILAYRVNSHDDSLDEQRSLYLTNVSHHFDWQFAYRGLISLYDYVDSILDAERTRNEEILATVTQMTTEREKKS